MGKRRAERPLHTEKTADAGAVAKRTRSSFDALALPPSRSRSPAAVQPPAASGDDRSLADVSAVELVGSRMRSKSSQRLPPPPTAQKKVSWAVPAANTGKEDSKQRAVPDAKMRTRTQPSRRGKGAAGEASNALAISPGNFDQEIQPYMQPTHSEQQPVGARGQRRRSKKDLSIALVPSSVRRSARIRSRPLRVWLGERMLYGRIQDDMCTIIGIKACSPGEDGKVELRVKSFLPDKYLDMVAQAGKY